MNFTPNHKQHRRPGLTLSELVIAAAIAVTAMVGIAQLMYQVTRQYRITSCRNLVSQEAANIMENLMSRPWSDIAAEEPPVIELSPACLQAVPEAQLELAIAAEKEQEDVRRITLQIHWQTQNTTPTAPIQLVAWRYAP